MGAPNYAEDPGLLSPFEVLSPRAYCHFFWGLKSRNVEILNKKIEIHVHTRSDANKKNWNFVSRDTKEEILIRVWRSAVRWTTGTSGKTECVAAVKPRQKRPGRRVDDKRMEKEKKETQKKEKKIERKKEKVKTH